MPIPPKRPVGRPRKNPLPTPATVDDEDLVGGSLPDAGDSDDEEISLDLAETYGGVSASWLSQMFGADKATIKKKLAASGIEIVGRRNGGPLYRLADAAPYLVKPKVDLVSFVKSLRPNDLPPMLNEAYWSAMLKRQKWEENAGDLWHTDDVLEVLGDLNFMIRSRVNLWAEDVDRTKGITDEQRKEINRLSDELLKAIHEQLVTMPSQRKKTRSSISEDGAVPDGAQESIREVDA